MSLTKQVVHSLKWTAVLRTLAQAVSWSVTLIVMRLLNPDDYGLMTVAMVGVGVMSLIAELGLGAALVQAEELDTLILRQVFGAVLLLNMGIITVLCCMAPAMAYFFHEPRLKLIVQVVSLQFLPIALCVVPDALLKRNMQFHTISFIEFTISIIGAVTTLSMAWVGYGVWALVAGTLAMAVCKAGALLWNSPGRCSPSFRMHGMRKHVLFGGQITATGILWFLYTEADVFLAGRLLGASSVGFYSVSKQLASLPMNKLSQILNQVLYPAFSRLQNEPERAAINMLRLVELITFVTIPVVWGMSCVSREFVPLLLGSKWEPAILPLQIICLVIPFRVVAGFTMTVAQSMGRADLMMVNALVSCMVMPAAFLIACRYGLEGLAWVWVIVYPWVLAFNIHCSVKIVGLGLSDIAWAMLPTLAVGVVMYATVEGLRLSLPLSTLTMWLRLTILVAIGAMVYIVSSLAVNRNPIQEILRLAR
jgi:teichuronic acid exporter